MKDGCRVKICGITNLEDAVMAARAGAHYLGVVVEVPFSPRSLTMEGAREIFSPPPAPAVALVYHMPYSEICRLIDTLKPTAVQFLSPAGELLAPLKKRYPKVELWQSIHLPAVATIGSAAGGGAAGTVSGAVPGNASELLLAAAAEPKNIAMDWADVQQQVEVSVTQGADLMVFDSAAVIGGEKRFGGTGQKSDWQAVAGLIRACPVKAWLAGGINPGNVREAIRTVNPAGIDLCSGVEAAVGKKSIEKIMALVQEVSEEQTAWEEQQLRKLQEAREEAQE